MKEGDVRVHDSDIADLSCEREHEGAHGFSGVQGVHDGGRGMVGGVTDTAYAAHGLAPGGALRARARRRFLDFSTTKATQTPAARDHNLAVTTLR
jgi:hypothetical protein